MGARVMLANLWRKVVYITQTLMMTLIPDRPARETKSKKIRREGKEGPDTMPKTNLCENRDAKRYNYVAGMISGGIRQQCLSTKDVSRKTGFPERTVTDRLKNPEDMRLRDLYKMCDVAGVKITFELKEVPE